MSLTRKDLEESLSLILPEELRRLRILATQVNQAALDCFIEKRSDIHAERVRVAAESLAYRGVFPWVADEVCEVCGCRAIPDLLSHEKLCAECLCERLNPLVCPRD